MTKDTIARLEKGNYISFSTRKKSGEFVSTAVWFAPDDDGYYLFSANKAGKVKRLRNFSESKMASCNVMGAVSGDWVDTRAYLLDSPEDEKKALAALRRKYGLQMLLGDCFSTLTGKMKKRAYIRVEVSA